MSYPNSSALLGVDVFQGLTANGSTPLPPPLVTAEASWPIEAGTGGYYALTSFSLQASAFCSLPVRRMHAVRGSRSFIPPS